MLVKTKFSIKDLENLSGIKAHTIRIWEKRYALLTPSRTDTNIRYYNLDNLKRLLNVTFLYQHGYKISKIKGLSRDALVDLVKELAKTNDAEHSVYDFKMAMFQFDQHLFATTYERLLENRTFPEVFEEVFIPLLTELGILWQVGTIDPCHERFVSEMIKQKIVLNIEKQYSKSILVNPPTIALFLPYREIHDIGLVYANYMCISQGMNTIYLGGNISMNSLKEVLKHHENIIFLTYLTVEPSYLSIVDFCEQYNELIGVKNKNLLWLMGSKTHPQKQNELPKNVKLIKSIPELSEALKILKNSQS
ncbi:MerR family transcriptional regulator [Rasiella rasia]|uniref:MerR family transcriptional regulator n=1 Tax=Rasiella rasia TaxID=2744027 RepID=A0A6G6GQE3_9FLAO|nr:MerR family transcriptional regulator [Rasiella rasia]QIE60653.1 MerR family transcriptional regulator [Rasiella rasia]